MSATKTFFDMTVYYSDRILIGIISTQFNINMISYKMRSSSGTEINHSVSITIDTEIADKLSHAPYWYFNVLKKDYRTLKEGNLTIAKIFKENGKTLAILFNGVSTLKVEIKEYSFYDYNYNHEVIHDVNVKIDDMILLKDFCSDDNHTSIANVWSFQGGLHATNGCHAMIRWTKNMPNNWSISKKDLSAIKLLKKLDDSLVFLKVNYMNNDRNKDEITETKLKVSGSKKINIEIDFEPTYSRPILESLIREDLKDRQVELSLKDLKNLKKELQFFKKNFKDKDDDLVRLDIHPGKIVLSDKTLLCSRSIDLEDDSPVCCLLTFKVDYILNVVNYIIDNKFPFTYLKWKHSRKILDPVLMTSYLSGDHQSTGILMPVLVRDESYYDLSYEEYKKYWRERE